MAQITDEQILQINNGKIIPGDYVIVSGAINVIKYNTFDVEFINIVLEKNGIDIPGYLNGTQPILCQNEVQSKAFSWLCNIIPNVNEDYPKYRIKVVSTQPPGIVAYSNYFKISKAIM
jgi:hypothetical protein